MNLGVSAQSTPKKGAGKRKRPPEEQVADESAKKVLQSADEALLLCLLVIFRGYVAKTQDNSPQGDDNVLLPEHERTRPFQALTRSVADAFLMHVGHDYNVPLAEQSVPSKLRAESAESALFFSHEPGAKFDLFLLAKLEEMLSKLDTNTKTLLMEVARGYLRNDSCHPEYGTYEESSYLPTWFKDLVKQVKVDPRLFEEGSSPDWIQYAAARHEAPYWFVFELVATKLNTPSILSLIR